MTGIDAGGIDAGGMDGDRDAVVAASGGLAEARRLRVLARHDRQEWPFALVVLGIVVLLAAPFYVVAVPTSGPGSSVVAVSETLGPLADIGPSQGVLRQWTGLYWIVALVVAGLVVAVHYRRAAARRGIAGPLWPFVAAGIVLLVALVFTIPRAVDLLATSGLPGRAALTTEVTPMAITLWLRGLTPLLVIGVAVLVLAWTERSGPLAAIGAGYLALAIAANTYDFSNLGQHAGLPFTGRFDLLPNLLLPGAALLAAGLVAAAVTRRGAR